MLLPCASSRGRAAAAIDGQRRIDAAVGTFWGYLATQTTAKGQAFISPQSAGAGCSQGGISPSDIAMDMPLIGPAAPGPAKAPVTRPTTARIMSKRERTDQIAIVLRIAQKVEDRKTAPLSIVKGVIWCSVPE